MDTDNTAVDLSYEPPLTDDEIRLLKQGYDEAMHGELLDARQVLEEIRAKYRLSSPGSEADELRMIREDYESAIRSEAIDAKQAIERIRTESDL